LQSIGIVVVVFVDVRVVFVMLVPKLTKTLTKGNPDQKTALEIEDTIKRSEACTRLGEAVGSRPSRKGFQAMKTDLDFLSGVGISPTVNVCRQWCFEYAQQALASGNPDKFVSCMRVHLTEDELELDDIAAAFDIDEPVLAFVTPSQADEASLAEERDPKPPPRTKELMMWEQDVQCIQHLCSAVWFDKGVLTPYLFLVIPFVVPMILHIRSGCLTSCGTAGTDSIRFPFA
jgi:hypothetical protein